MGNKSPAVLFYYDNFWGGVELMSDAEIVRYLRLLTINWRNYPRRIPPAKFAELCGGSAEIASKFVVDSDGNYYNERAEIVGKVAYEKSARGKNAIRQRWGKIQNVIQNVLPDVIQNVIQNVDTGLSSGNGEKIQNVIQNVSKNTNVIQNVLQNEYTTFNDIDTPLSFDVDVNNLNNKDTLRVIDGVDVGVKAVGVEGEGVRVTDTGKPRRGKPPMGEFAPPEHLADMWPDYLAVRKHRNAAPTVRAFVGIVRRLETLAPHDHALQRAILEQSIIGGWTDVYALKDNRTQGSRYGPQEVDKRRIVETGERVLTQIWQEREERESVKNKNEGAGK